MKARNLLVMAAALLLVNSVAMADVVMTYAEAAGQMFSQVPGAITETFDNLTVGSNYTNSGYNVDVPFAGNASIGVYDKLSILAANQYGGANGTHYAVTSDEDALGNIPETTLQINNSTYNQYFGLWWSAGDAANVLEFFNGNTLVAYFTTQNLLNHLNMLSPDNYKGKPAGDTYAGKDSGENFAYINFYATAGTSWDKIVFINNATSGFENDNNSVAAWSASGTMLGTPLEDVSGTTIVTTYDLSGTSTSNQQLPPGGIVSPDNDIPSVPEPATVTALLATLAASGLIIGKRKLKI
jgi:hypothetical protein